MSIFVLLLINTKYMLGFRCQNSHFVQFCVQHFFILLLKCLSHHQKFHWLIHVLPCMVNVNHCLTLLLVVLFYFNMKLYIDTIRLISICRLWHRKFCMVLLMIMKKMMSVSWYNKRHPLILNIFKIKSYITKTLKILELK